MKKYIIPLLIYGLFSLALSACHEELEPTPYTFTKYFTGEKSKTWAMTIIEYTVDGTVEDRFSLPCANDDKYIFHATSDRLYEVKSGSNKCSADDPDTLVDTWGFTNATATLTIILPILSSRPLPFIVKKVDDNDLTLEIFFDQEGVESYRIFFKLTDEE